MIEKSKNQKHPGGRPTLYSDELAKTICKRIASGESVRAIGRDDEMPTATTIFDWALNKPEFSEQYAQARAIQAESEFESLNEIAETEEDVMRARLIIDTRKWALSKKLPKKYGDKLDLTSDGERIQANTIVITDFSADETDSQ